MSVPSSLAPARIVGNDMVAMHPIFNATPASGVAVPVLMMPSVSTSIPVTNQHTVTPSPWQRAYHKAHAHAVVSFALLFLIVGSSSVLVTRSYLSARIDTNAASTASAVRPGHANAGLNLTLPHADLDSRLRTITNQQISLAVGDKHVSIDSDTIKSWLQITPTTNADADMIHVKIEAVAKSLSELAASQLQTPVNEVSVSHDSAAPIVIAVGHNGTKLSDPDGLKNQAKSLANSLLAGAGAGLTTPTETLPFQAVTPVAFSKMIEVDVTTKRMYAYENGQLARTFLISAGAPATPTPIGVYHIFSKLAVQDMSGYNANGTKYFQPHVRWINYFLPGGYAIHGNYWRPLSWFGAINSSHGCASLPDDQAKWVFDWAPMGTTVITHA